jgi:hypothetical protein
MHRRNFLVAPIALASLWGCASSTPQTTSNAGLTTASIPLSLSRVRAGSRGLFCYIDRLVPGDVTVKVDIWLRLDIDQLPPGGILIRPSIKVFEDAPSGRRPLLNSDDLEGKSGPNSNEVHIVGTTSGVSHDDVFRPMWLDFGISRAVYFNPAEQSGATVSTVPGKESYVIVTTR